LRAARLKAARAQIACPTTSCGGVSYADASAAEAGPAIRLPWPAPLKRVLYRPELGDCCYIEGIFDQWPIGDADKTTPRPYLKRTKTAEPVRSDTVLHTRLTLNQAVLVLRQMYKPFLLDSQQLQSRSAAARPS
jgi:hypothetical protein